MGGGADLKGGAGEKKRTPVDTPQPLLELPPASRLKAAQPEQHPGSTAQMQIGSRDFLGTSVEKHTAFVEPEASEIQLFELSEHHLLEPRGSHSEKLHLPAATFGPLGSGSRA